MNNYRVTYYHDKECDYWNNGTTGHWRFGKGKQIKDEQITNFRDWPKEHYPLVRKIIDKAKRQYGIKFIWFFYEPHIEITWLDDQPKNSERLIKAIRRELKKAGVTDAKFLRPKNGPCGDWFCTTEKEREFGAKRHALCQEWIALYNDYKDVVDTGKGLNAQLSRTIHTLCNPLGINFKDEYKICFRHFFGYWLVCKFGYKAGKWIGRWIFRLK